MQSLSTFSVVGLLGLHIGAVLCGCATRVAAGSRAEGVLQVVFLAAMAGVGLSAWYSQGHDLGLGLPSGLTLAAMVLMAVTDFHRTDEPTYATPLSLHR